MFYSSNTPALAQRLLRGVRLVRSFLFLEDDYEVDWEVDQDELAELPTYGFAAGREDSSNGVHLHRRAPQSRLGSRRPGVVAAREQVCLCPMGGRARAGVSRSSFLPAESCAINDAQPGSFMDQ
jgi:hypothetical protein